MHSRKHSRKYKIGAGPKKTATTRQREANLAIERKIREREVQERATALMRNRKEREREARLEEARERFGIFEEPKKSSSNRGYYRDLYLSSSSENPSSSKKKSARPNMANIAYSQFAAQTPKEKRYNRKVYKRLNEMEKEYQDELAENKEKLRADPNALEENMLFGLEEEIPRQKTGAVQAIGRLGLEDGAPDSDEYGFYDLHFKGGKTRRRKRRTKQTRRKKSRRRI